MTNSCFNRTNSLARRLMWPAMGLTSAFLSSPVRAETVREQQVQEAERATAMEVRLATSEFAFSPPSLRVVAGRRVSLILDNSKGETEHGVFFPGFGLRVFAHAGETVKYEYVFGRSGEFEFVCDLPGHVEAGMKGRLTVVASDETQPKRADAGGKKQ